MCMLTVVDSTYSRSGFMETSCGDKRHHRGLSRGLAATIKEKLRTHLGATKPRKKEALRINVRDVCKAF